MLRVIGKRAVIRRIEAPKLTSSLIEIVEFEPEQSPFALVLAVGNVDGFQAGDTVITRHFSGAPITVDGEECQIIQEEDVLAVVEI